MPERDNARKINGWEVSGDSGWSTQSDSGWTTSDASNVSGAELKARKPNGVIHDKYIHDETQTLQEMLENHLEMLTNTLNGFRLDLD